MRPIICRHRRQRAGLLELASLLGDHVVDGQIRNPRILGEAVLLILGGMHVGLEMDGIRAHIHPLGHRIHFDASQVIGHDLQIVLHNRLADIELPGLRNHRQGSTAGKGEYGNKATYGHTAASCEFRGGYVNLRFAENEWFSR